MTYLLKNALAEGSEEITSDAVNWLADVMISQDKSEWQETLFHYQVMGFSEDEAFLAAMKEQGRKMLKDGAAGAITGTITAGGRLAGSKIQDGIQNYRNYKGAVQNGKQYYALNQLTQGGLARSLGNMNVEQSYRSMSPETILESSGLKPREIQSLLESRGAEINSDLQFTDLKQYEVDLFPEGEINQNRALTREEEWSHRKGKGGDYGVAWSSIDQTDYEACFSQLTNNEKVSRVISTRAEWLLNTYDGRKMETLYAIDLNDGTEIGNRVGVEGYSGVERSEKFEAKLNAAESKGSQILLVHNHPEGSPPSITDINSLLRSERAAGIVVGHDGSVYYYTRPERVIPKVDFAVAYDKHSRYTIDTAHEKALDELAKRYHFTWKKLR